MADSVIIDIKFNYKESGLKGVTDDIEYLKRRFESVRYAMKNAPDFMKTDIEKRIQEIDGAVSKIAQLVQQTNQYKTELSQLSNVVGRMGKVIKGGVDKSLGSVSEEQLAQAKENLRSARDAYNKSVDETTKAAAQEFSAIDKELDALGSEATQLETNRQKLEEYGDSLKDVLDKRKELRNTYALDSENKDYGNEPAHSALDNAQKNVEEINNGVKRMNAGVNSSQKQFYYLFRAIKMAANEAQRLDKNASKMLNGLATVAKTTAKSMLALATGFLSLRKNTKSATSSHQGFIQSFKTGFWTILKYTLGIRSLYMLMRRLRKALAEGMENLATAMPEVNRQMSSLVTSLMQMKNAVATAVQPLLNVLAPALEKIADLCSRAAVAIASFFATLTGQAYVYKAKRAQQSYVDNAKAGADAAEDQADAQEELNQQLADFDKLNVLTTDKNKDKNKDKGGAGDGGIGDMFEKVPIEGLENLKKWLEDFFYPIKEAWKREGKYVMDAWKYALKQIWELLKDINRDFMEMWHQEKTIKMFQDIFHTLGDIGFIVGNLAKQFRAAWNENRVGFHILEDIRDIFAIIFRTVREIADYAVDWSASLDFYPLLKSIHSMLMSFKPLLQAIADLVEYFFTKVVMPYMKYVLEKALPKLNDVIAHFFDAINKVHLKEKIKQLMDALEPFLEKLTEALIIIVDDLLSAIADFINGDTFDKIIDFITDLMKKADPEKMAKFIESLVKSLIKLKVALKGISIAFGVAQGALSFINVFKQAKLLTSLSKGATGLTVMSTSAQRLGTVLKGVVLPVLGKIALSLGGFAVNVAGVSSGVKGLLTNGNKAANILKIIGGALVGIITSLLAFGPAGWVIAALGAAIGLCKGIADAIREINDELSQDALTKAFSGGESLSDKVLDLTQKLRDFGREFTEISDRSEQLKLAQTNIHDTWTEIGLIKEKMDAGVISVDEGTAKMEELFAQLAEQASESFNELNTQIMMAFGDGSAIGKMYDMLGYDISGFTTSMIQLNEQAARKIESLNAELKSLDWDDPRRAAITKEMMVLTGEIDSTEESLIRLHNFTDNDDNKIDLTEFIKGGELNADELLGSLSSIPDAISEVHDNVVTEMDQLGVDLKLELNKAVALNNTEAIDSIQEKLSAIPQIIDEVDSEANRAGAKLTDDLQDQLVDNLSTVIDNAEKAWEDKKNSYKTDVGKWWFERMNPKDWYVGNTIAKYQESVNKISDGIEEQFAALGLEGAGWSKDAMEKILNAITDVQVDTQSLEEFRTLKDDWKQILDDMIPELELESQHVGSSVAEAMIDEYGRTLVDRAEIVTGRAGGGMPEVVRKTFDSPLVQQAIDEGVLELSNSVKEGTKTVIDNGIDAYTTNLENAKGIVSGSLAGGMPSAVREGYAKALPEIETETDKAIGIVTGKLAGGMPSDIREKFNSPDVQVSIKNGIQNGLDSSAEQVEVDTAASTVSDKTTEAIGTKIEENASTIQSSIETSVNTAVTNSDVSQPANDLAIKFDDAHKTSVEADMPPKLGSALTTVFGSESVLAASTEGAKLNAKNYVDGYLEEVKAGFESPEAQEVFKIPQKTHANEEESHSPSEVAKRQGRYYAEGYIIGLREVFSDGSLLVVFDELKVIMEEQLTEIKDYMTVTWWEDFSAVLFDEKLEGLKTRFFDEWLSNFKTMLFDEQLEEIKTTFFDEWLETLTTTLFDEKLETIRSRFFDEWLTTFKTALQTSLEEIKTTITTMIDTTNQTLTTGLDAAKNNFSAACDAIVASADSMADAVVAAAARAAAALASIGGGGGGMGGVSIPIPQMATGGVIPANHKFLAILGDQKHGTNIEAPLKTIVDAMNISLAKSGGASSKEEIELLRRQNQLLQQLVNKDIVVDQNKMFKTIRNEARTFEKSTGIPAFNFT